MAPFLIGQYTASASVSTALFQDGNGKVGRLIALKECLKNGIVPFMIEDSKKMFYYRGLAEGNTKKGI